MKRSSSLITNLDGEIVQKVELMPFGEVFLEERNNKWNTPYLFNAKELDEETGLYYYGARYYDARTSFWLSADPLQEKYPNVSTYAYCVQNPVKFVDPDGKDYRLIVDHENAIVTVSATYYASSQDLSSAQQAVDYWNNQSGNFTYETHEGNYTVQFSLFVVEVETDASMGYKEARGSLNQAFSSDKTGQANVYQVIADSDSRLDSNTNGTTSNGNFILVKDSRKSADTGSHEVGHTLGLIHTSSGLMTPSSTDINRSRELDTKGLNDMVSKPLQGKTNSESGNNAGKGIVTYSSSSYSTDHTHSPLNNKGKIKK